MTDKNNREMKTGDIVKIENAYFKNDNGLYFIEHTPGDRSWCGSDYSLRKICKNGRISSAKYSITFWPLSAVTNDREKNAAAREHNKNNATIEIVYTVDRSQVIEHFESEATAAAETAENYKWHFGEGSEVTQKQRSLAVFYQSIADRMKDEDRTPAQEIHEETAEEVHEGTTEEITTQEAQEAPTMDEATAEVKSYSIDEKTAERAWYAVHMGDYKPGSASAEYAASVEEVKKLAEAQKQKVSAFYHDKIDALCDKYARRLAKWYDDYNRNEASCPSWFIAGPANYPVRKHERKMNRERTLWAEYDEIKAIKDRIKAVGTGSIDLADPNAREMLTERIEALKAEQERSKAINAYWRKNKTLAGFPGMDHDKAERMTAEINDTLTRCPWISQPVPAFELTSMRDKIKRTEERLAELDRRQEAPKEDEQHDGFQIVHNTELDRLQILFDEIPSAEIRAALKGNGFRWSPRNKAWQRQLTDNAERAARIALNLT